MNDDDDEDDNSPNIIENNLSMLLEAYNLNIVFLMLSGLCSLRRTHIHACRYITKCRFIWQNPNKPIRSRIFWNVPKKKKKVRAGTYSSHRRKRRKKKLELIPNIADEQTCIVYLFMHAPCPCSIISVLFYLFLKWNLLIFRNQLASV